MIERMTDRDAWRRPIAVVLTLAFVGTAHAQGAAEPKGHEVLTAKCFQCHTDAMWRDQRQSATAWEATLYRTIGRGALWEPDEIKKMPDYLGSDFGPNAAGAANRLDRQTVGPTDQSRRDESAKSLI